MKWLLYAAVLIFIMTGCSTNNDNSMVDNKEKVVLSSAKSDDGAEIVPDSVELPPEQTPQSSEPVYTNVCESDNEIKVDLYYNVEKEYGVVSRVVGGKVLWEYKMPEDDLAQISSVSMPYVYNDTVYVTGGGSLYALNKSDGSVLWSTQGISGVSSMAFDDVNIYVSCYLDTDFYVVRTDGEIIHEESDPEYGCVVDSKIDGNTLYLYCEDAMAENPDTTREVAVDISAYK